MTVALETRTKVFAGELKAIPSDGSRRGSAIVYVYGAPDDDPILDKLYARRDDLKLRWAHGVNPDDIIGKITAVRFLRDRVEIDFELFQTPQGEKVYELMLLGGVTEFSVGFNFEEADVYKGEDERWHVRKAELTEVSAVPAGANRETMLTAIKALGEKAGRTISAKNEASLKQARDIIDSILSTLERQEPEMMEEMDGKAVEEWLKAEEAQKTPDAGLKRREELAQQIRLLMMDVA